jgi:hypothetical protein
MTGNSHRPLRRSAAAAVTVAMLGTGIGLASTTANAADTQPQQGQVQPQSDGVTASWGGRTYTAQTDSNGETFTVDGTGQLSQNNQALAAGMDVTVSNTTVSPAETKTITLQPNGDANVPATGDGPVTRRFSGTTTVTLHGQAVTVTFIVNANRPQSTRQSVSYEADFGDGNRVFQDGQIPPSIGLAANNKPSDPLTFKKVVTTHWEHSGNDTRTETPQSVRPVMVGKEEVSRPTVGERRHIGNVKYVVKDKDGVARDIVAHYDYVETSAIGMSVDGHDYGFVSSGSNGNGFELETTPDIALRAGTRDKSGARVTFNEQGSDPVTIDLDNPPAGYTVRWASKEGTVDHSGVSNTVTVSGTVSGKAWSATFHAKRALEFNGQTLEERSLADGTRLNLGADGMWTGVVAAQTKEPVKKVRVNTVVHRYYEDGTYKTADDVSGGFDTEYRQGKNTDTMPQFGVTHHEGDGTYSNTDMKTTLTTSYSYNTGAERRLLLTGGATVPLTIGADGVWRPSSGVVYTDMTDDNQLTGSDRLTFTGSGGDNVFDVTSDGITINRGKLEEGMTLGNTGALINRLSGTLSGDMGGFRFEVPFTAMRSYNDHIKELTVLETDPSGNTVAHPLDIRKVKTNGENRYKFSLDPLDYASSKNQFSIAPGEMGGDVKVTVSTAQREDDGSLSFTVVARSHNYTNTYEVSVLFKKAPVTPDPQGAHLNGISVNGKPIQDADGTGFNPDRLDYTIRVGENDHVFIQPEAGDGVFLSAGDVEQSAAANTYSWTVSAPGKHTLTYKVTVVRQRDWKTADEQYTPKEGVLTPGTITAQPGDTELQSHGYIDAKSGKYVPVQGDDYQVDGDDTFSYQPKQGQLTTLTVRKVKGMTYRYTVYVSNPDPKAKTGDGTLAAHVFTVTYKTPETQMASLQQIKVNGNEIKDFQPGRMEYTVNVPRPDQWTLVPVFDQRTGMKASTHKDGQDAQIKVTSADGLNTVTYKVHVVQDPGVLAKIQGGSTGVLAQTGSGVTGVVAAAVVILAAALAAIVAVILHRKRQDGNDVEEVDVEDVKDEPDGRDGND